jgi:hypothetical protein
MCDLGSTHRISLTYAFDTLPAVATAASKTSAHQQTLKPAKPSLKNKK